MLYSLVLDDWPPGSAFRVMLSFPLFVALACLLDLSDHRRSHRLKDHVNNPRWNPPIEFL